MTDGAVSNPGRVEWDTDRLSNLLVEAVPLVAEGIVGRLEINAPAGSTFRVDGSMLSIMHFGIPTNGSVSVRMLEGTVDVVDSFEGEYCVVARSGDAVTLDIGHTFEDGSCDYVSVIASEAVISVQPILDPDEQV